MYVGLTANQRVRLSIAALARDDDRERALLWESAPKQRYLGNEVAYNDVMDLASELATLFAAAELSPRLAKLELLELTRLLVEEFLVPMAPDGRADEPPPVAADASQERRIELLLEVLEMLQERMAEAGAATVHGFSAFCHQEFQLAGEDMISAFAQAFVPAYRRFAAIEADPEAASEVCEQWSVVWRDRMRHRAHEGPGRPPYRAEHH